MAGVGIGREHDEEMTIFNSAGLATIEYIERENVLGRVREKAPWFKSEWDKIEKDFINEEELYPIDRIGNLRV